MTIKMSALDLAEKDGTEKSFKFEIVIDEAPDGIGYTVAVQGTGFERFSNFRQDTELDALETGIYMLRVELERVAKVIRGEK